MWIIDKLEELRDRMPCCVRFCEMYQKYYPVLASILFVLGSQTLIIFSAILYRDYARFSNLGVDSVRYMLPPCLIVINIILMPPFLVVYWCVTNVNVKKLIAFVYFSLLALMLLGLVIESVRDQSERARTESEFSDAFINALDNYDNDSWSSYREQVNMIQADFRCCGVYNASDWLNTTWYLNQSEPRMEYPPSCCYPHDCTQPGALHNKGCFDPVMEKFMKHIKIMFFAAGQVATMLAGEIVMMFIQFTCWIRQRRAQSNLYTRCDSDCSITPPITDNLTSNSSHEDDVRDC